MKSTVAGASSAAATAGRNGVELPVPVPGLGRLRLPPGPHLAYYAGLGILAAAEVVEWPVALLLAAGKALADNRSHKTLEEFGEALESA